MEVMIVVAIIAITAAFALPNMIGKRADVKLRGAVNNLKGDLNVAKSMAVRENANVVILFFEKSYRVFVDNGAAAGHRSNLAHNDDERLLRNRQLPGGVSIDIANTDLGTECTGPGEEDCTLFNERGLPDPNNLGTIFVVDGSGEQRKIEIHPLGRLTVE